MKTHLNLKKNKGQPIAISVVGPNAHKIPGAFINGFAHPKIDESELPFSSLTVGHVLQWAQSNNVEIEVHPTVQQALLADSSKYKTAQSDAAAYLQKHPYIFEEKLYAHQRQGVHFALTNYFYNNKQLRVLFADDPRLGKSPLAIATLDALNMSGHILILCPKALVHQWATYVQTWSRNNATIILDGDTKRKKLLFHSAQELHDELFPVYFVTNWETLRSMPELVEHKWSAFIGDEAHKLKNRKSGISQLVSQIQTPHILLLSATFVENFPNQWWNPLHTIKPDVFTSYWRWYQNYIESAQGYHGLTPVRPQNIEIMKQQVAPYILQRRSDDVVDMPEKIYETIYCELTGNTKRLYDQLKRSITAEFEELDLPNKVAKIMALRQAAIHPALLDNNHWQTNMVDGKLATLQTIVEQLPENESVLIFSSFVEACKIAAYTVRQAGNVGVYAGANANDDFITQFQNKQLRILCCTPQKGGVGLNLFVANYVIFVDLPWSTIDIRQAEERVRAMGKREPVQIIRLIANNTIDEYVFTKILNKLNNVSQAEVLRTAEGYFK